VTLISFDEMQPSLPSKQTPAYTTTCGANLTRSTHKTTRCRCNFLLFPRD